MNKEKVFAWIESLEDMADQSDRYFVERTELYKENQEKDKEIDRLNNIIDGMEKFFKYEFDNEVRPLNDRKISVWTICLDKLQELKENKHD